MPKSKQHPNKTSRLAHVLVIGGLALLIIAILVVKQKPQTSSPLVSSTDPPEAQLDRALQIGQPTLSFFHSNNCQQCIVMMDTVAQVYPEFSDSVMLVDVNVYDELNQALLQRVGLQFIPTLIFFDRAGQGQVSVGVMEAEQLKQTLASLAGDK
jgi:thioredoxin-like negative regulator of GroEL